MYIKIINHHPIPFFHPSSPIIMHRKKETKTCSEYVVVWQVEFREEKTTDGCTDDFMDVRV